MHKKTVLENGLRVITQKSAGTKAVTVLILCGAGSRYEDQSIRGISHFLEHMFFKGANRYKNAREVSEAIDSVGGEFNAFTGKEYAGYFVKVASEHFETAADVLSDMLVNAKFDSHEIEKERGVILEEFNMYQDTPMYQVGWDFENLLFGEQPMGWDEIGTKELIKNVTHEDFLKYKNSLYTADNCVVCVAGNIDEKKVIKTIEEKFNFGNEKRSRGFEGFKPDLAKDLKKLHIKKTEQTHIVCGARGIPEGHADHYVEQVLSTILGGNMSSRMFMAVREEKGLCYYVKTETDNYTDCGAISTRAGVDVNRAVLAIDAIKAEYARICDEVVSEKELSKGKEFIKGKIALRLEDSEEMAHLLGKYELLYGKIKTVEEIARGVDAVTAEDVQRVARELLAPENLRIAAIGPVEGLR